MDDTNGYTVWDPEWTAKEKSVITELALDLTPPAVVRQALRLYQLYNANRESYEACWRHTSERS